MFKTGDIISNGTSAGEVIKFVTRDPHWKTSGWRIKNIPMSQFGGNAGTTSFLPNYLIASWKVVVPGQWYPSDGGGLESRYVWSPDYHHLQKEHQVPAKSGLDTSQSSL